MILIKNIHVYLYRVLTGRNLALTLKIWVSTRLPIDRCGQAVAAI